MKILKEQKTYRSSGTPVLNYITELESDTAECIKDFYKSIAKSFEASVAQCFLPLALNDYDRCTDRRKKYRFCPKTAVFRCVTLDKDIYELTVSYDGIVYICERHRWDRDTIVKRKRIR